MLVLLMISQVEYKLVHFQYNVTSCLICHQTPIQKINDTIYIAGGIHRSGNYATPMLIALKVKQGIQVLWYKAFTGSNLDMPISSLAKINDTLIAVGGGRYGCDCSFIGLFNLNTQNFVWVKRLFSNGHVRDIAFDGNSIVGVTWPSSSGNGSIVKLDINGNVLWSRWTNWSNCNWDANHAIVPTIDGYIVVSVIGDGAACNWEVRTAIYKVSVDGNSATFIKGFRSCTESSKLIKDNDGNYVLIGYRKHTGNCLTPDAYLIKMDQNFNIVYGKLYSAGNKLKFLNIVIDLDGNYLIVGNILIGSTSYPIVLKINKNDGSVIWARYWAGASSNQRYNEARGIAPIKLNKFLLSGYLGTGLENYNGYFVILDSIGAIDSCLSPLVGSINVSNFTPSSWTPPGSILGSISTTNLTLTPYNFSISSTQGCQITPINFNEYKSCNFRIYAGKGYIKVISNNEINLRIYDIRGKKVKEVLIKEGEIRLKPGIYIIKVNNESLKLVVN